MTDHTSRMYVEIETKLSWSIEQDTGYHVNKTGQWRDQSYKYGLCRHQNWTVMIDQIGCGLSRKDDKLMWSII